MGWVLTKGLNHLRDQMNAAFPDRDKASDGTVGDLAHQLSASDHNPDRTGKAAYKDGDTLDEVRAWDMDSDLRTPGVTAQQLVDHIRALPGVSSVLRYIIFNRKIYEASNGWKATSYTGPSPHTEHIHFSGARSQAADSNTTFNYRLEEIAMPTPAEYAEAVWDHALADPTTKKAKQAGTYLSWNDQVTVNAADKVIKAVGPKVDALEVKLDQLREIVSDLSAKIQPKP